MGIKTLVENVMLKLKGKKADGFGLQVLPADWVNPDPKNKMLSDINTVINQMLLGMIPTDMGLVEKHLAWLEDCRANWVVFMEGLNEDELWEDRAMLAMNLEIAYKLKHMTAIQYSHRVIELDLKSKEV